MGDLDSVILTSLHAACQNLLSTREMVPTGAVWNPLLVYYILHLLGIEKLLTIQQMGIVTPFQIFNEVIMPDFVYHISKGKQFLPAIDENDSSSSSEEDLSSYNLQKILEKIHNDLIYIRKACGRLKQWEDHVNHAIKDLVLQSLDDAFKERTGLVLQSLDDDSKERTENFLHNKLNKTHSIVSSLKEFISRPPELSSVNSNVERRFSKHSMVRGDHRSVFLPIQLQDVNIHKRMAEISTFKGIEAVYNELDVQLKLCFLCFSAFPENAVIKKKVLVHWWIGEGFIDTLGTQGNTAEKTAEGFFKEFIAKGLIKPVYKRRRPSADSCSIDPSIRYAVIMLAERAKFFSFDKNGNPTEDFTCSRRACLVKTEEGSSIRELPYHLQQENVQSMINVNEPNLDFRPDWFSKMRYVMVLQLGRWQSSSKHLIQLEDSEFLKGLKNMRHLRYLSLRGVSRITELPASICKLSNLRILNLNGCLDLEQLPQGIGSLKNLTHLDMYECYLISHMPKGVALLSQLQVLKGFVIGEPKPGGKGQHCKLADLSSLENLRKLSIHVDKMSDAAKRELISLAKFDKLRSLSISWSRLYGTPKTPPTLQKMLTKKLASISKSTKQPPRLMPPSLSVSVPWEKLNLHYFPGSKMPDWLMEWKMNKLKKLHIRGGSLSNLCQCQWSVKMVRLKFLSELQMDWPKLQELFPDLIYLEIFKCPKLSFLPCDEDGVWKKAEDSRQEN